MTRLNADAATATAVAAVLNRNRQAGNLVGRADVLAALREVADAPAHDITRPPLNDDDGPCLACGAYDRGHVLGCPLGWIVERDAGTSATTGESYDTVQTPHGLTVAVNSTGWWTAPGSAYVPVADGVDAAHAWEVQTGLKITAPGWRS